MQIKFTWCNLSCLASGSFDADGNFEADSINVMGELDTSELAAATVAVDYLYAELDKAAAEHMKQVKAQYTDLTHYFGEDY